MKLDFTPTAVIVNSGIMTQIGMGYASGGWWDLLHNVKRTNPSIPTLREWIEKFHCRVHFHNPGGLHPVVNIGEFPMRFEQLDIAMSRALQVEDTTSAEYKAVTNRLNILEFVRACDALPHRRHAYIGAPHRFKLRTGETQSAWLARANKVLEPWKRGCQLIGLDNTMGSRPGMDKIFCGPNGLQADLIIDLKRTHAVGKEPARYVTDTWMKGTDTFLSEKFLRARISRNKPGATIWDDRLKVMIPGTDDHVDHEPLVAAGSEGENVWITPETWFEPNVVNRQKVVDHLNKLRQDFPDSCYKIMVYPGHLDNRTFES